MPLKTRDVISQLQSKFHFSLSNTRSDDHLWYELKIPGLPVIATKVSHGKTEIGDILLGMMAKQLRVRKAFFAEMIQCTKSEQDYLNQVEKDPFPPWNVRF